ncbi:MAG: hypothetical protein ACR5K4_02680 [Sodalis sp. (in: enterobacteria)]
MRQDFSVVALCEMFYDNKNGASVGAEYKIEQRLFLVINKLATTLEFF